MTHGPSISRREQIHLPGPSLIPLTTAIGITIMLVGLILSWWFVATGATILVVSVVRWVHTVRSDIDSLPPENG